MHWVEAANQIHTPLNIPVIFLTAYTGKKVLERVMISGPFEYLIKPFEEKELHTTIETSLISIGSKTILHIKI